MDTDWWARGIAIFGASIALGTLAWNIFAWHGQGPVVRIATATCVGRGPEMTLSATGHNGGRFDAVIARVTLQWWAPSGAASGGVKKFECSVPVEHIPPIASFNRALPAQTDFSFDIVDLPGLDPSLNVALHEKRRAALVLHTGSGKRARRRIDYR